MEPGLHAKMHKRPNRLHLTIGLLTLGALLATGCASNRSRPPLKVPADATPEARAAALDKAEALARDAQRQELAGHKDEAIKKYGEAINTFHDLPVAWNNLGVLWAEQGKNLEAAEAYKTAAELSPTDPRPLKNLGALWEELGYLDDAARWYDEALQRDPNYLPALRRAILVDDLRNQLSETTAERMKAAIIIEREPWWIERFKRIQQRMNARPLAERVPDDHRARGLASP